MVADLRTPSGGQFEEQGVVPNIIVERKVKDYKEKRDPELESAISYLREQIGKVDENEAMPSHSTDEQQ